MLIVNLFGNSCSGKTTHSAGLFSALKKEGINVELVREECKKWFYDGTTYKLDNQFLITGEQIAQTELYRAGGCDVVVTDSPILLGAIYTQVYNVNIPLCMAIRDAHHKNDNYNILLKSNVPFKSEGRGSSGISRDKIFNLIMREGLIFDKEYNTTELESYKVIVNQIKKRLEC